MVLLCSVRLQIVPVASCILIVTYLDALVKERLAGKQPLLKFLSIKGIGEP